MGFPAANSKTLGLFPGPLSLSQKRRHLLPYCTRARPQYCLDNRSQWSPEETFDHQILMILITSQAPRQRARGPHIPALGSALPRLLLLPVFQHPGPFGVGAAPSLPPSLPPVPSASKAPKTFPPSPPLSLLRLGAVHLLGDARLPSSLCETPCPLLLLTPSLDPLPPSDLHVHQVLQGLLLP